MVIRASSGKTVDRLIDDLWNGDPVARDAAVARLTVIGERALQRLLDLVASTEPSSEAKAAAFRALEGIGDPKALDAAIEAIVSADAIVATAATGVARALMHTPRGMTALDRLTAAALDEQLPTSVRLAAARALSELDPTTVQPVFAALMASSNEVVAAEAARTDAPAAPPASAASLLESAAAGRLPESPDALRRAIGTSGAQVDVERLRDLVEQVRIREGADDAALKLEWMATRAAAHAALAQRGSRLALFDLRETLERAKEPLAVEFLTALLEIGDASCLEPLAAADAGAAASGLSADDWWRQRLAEVFRAIATREGTTRRHQEARKIDKRWPGSFQRMMKGF